MLSEFHATFPLFGYVCALLLGLIFGSFLNVVILRLPSVLMHRWRSDAHEMLELPFDEPAPPGIAWTRSQCPKCGHQLAAWENVPLLSYLILRGRCSACRTRISPQYPIVEAIAGASAVGCLFLYGPTTAFVLAGTLCLFLIALTVIDFRTMLLPDDLVLPLLWLGLASNAFGSYFTSPASAVFGAAFGYLSLWSVYHGFRLLTGKEGMGYGDFKLFAALGAWLGAMALVPILLVASLTGILYAIGTTLVRGRETSAPFPFGPFLALGGIGYLFLSPLFGRWLGY